MVLARWTAAEGFGLNVPMVVLFNPCKFQELRILPGKQKIAIAKPEDILAKLSVETKFPIQIGNLNIAKGTTDRRVEFW